MIAIVYGPQGSGKTTVHAPALRAKGYSTVHETNDPGSFSLVTGTADIFRVQGKRLVRMGKGRWLGGDQ